MLIDLIRVPDLSCIDDLLDEPLGLLYLGSVLRENNYKVRITNLAGHSSESWKPKIKEADLYGIQLYTPTANIGIEIAKFIKGIFPNKAIICGGAHPSAIPESEELAVFDHIVVGEGEESIIKIVNAYNSGKIIPRIVRGSFIEDLDSIPFPAWDLVDMNMFHRKVDGKRCFGIVGSRGCFYQCAFCDRSLFGERVRFRSVENIVNEVRKIISNYEVRHFEFFDDMFTINKRRLIEFKDKVKALNISYRCNGRADILSKKIYDLLYDSGCKVICFGIESGSQKMLDLMKKGTTVEKNLKAIEIAQEAGLIVIGYFILGFPGETRQTIQESIEFIEKSNIDQAQFYTFIPLPGCEVYRHLERFGAKIISRDFSDYYLVTGTDGRGGKTVETQFLSADEIQEEMKKIRKFLKERTSKGYIQDYYTDKLKYQVSI